MVLQSLLFSLWKIGIVIALLADHGSSFTITTGDCGLQQRQCPPPPLPVISSMQTIPESKASSRGLQQLHLGATSTDETENEIERQFLDEKQLDFILGYLNKHHGNVFVSFAETFSKLGAEKAKKNAWSGGSYMILSATIVDINTESFELDVEIQERSKESTVKRVVIELGT